MGGTIKLTFGQYEKMVDTLGKMGLRPDGFWPSVSEVKKELEPNFRKNLPFLIWLLEYNPSDNLSKEDKVKRRYIQKVINTNLELVYDAD